MKLIAYGLSIDVSGYAVLRCASHNTNLHTEAQAIATPERAGESVSAYTHAGNGQSIPVRDSYSNSNNSIP